MARDSSTSEKRGVFLASQLALDFLNTEWPTATTKEDFFEKDEDVLTWLRQAGLAFPGVSAIRPSGSLLRTAHALRAVIRELVEARKTGKTPDVSDLNAFLIAAQSHPRLVLNKGKSLVVEMVRPSDNAEQVLAPVALKAAELFSAVDFRRVRLCDDPTCVHWFFDQTKPGRRRWCSMATCGNRLKVKSYRKRLKAQ